MILVEDIMNYKKYFDSLLFTIILVVIIHLTYKAVYKSDDYKIKFNTCLLIIVLITTMIITLIKNSLSISLGLLGVISIIRFRIKLNDYRDVGFILWGIGTGIAIGTENYFIGLFYAILISAYFIYSSKKLVKNKKKYTLIIHFKEVNEIKLKKILSEYCITHKVLYEEEYTTENKEVIYQIEVKNKNNQKLKEKLLDSLEVEFIKFI